MPYTPPAHSPSASPSSSRSSSFSHNDNHTCTTLNLLNKNNPPRSTTYLHKHRRNSSASVTTASIVQLCAPTTKITETLSSSPDTMDRSVHQCAPPDGNGSSVMPTGATFSPPESSDEEDLKRKRDLGRLEHQLKEMIIMSLPKGRSSSPDSSVPRSLPQPQKDSTPNRGRSMRSHNRTQSHPTILVDIGTRPRSGSDSDSSNGDDDFRIGRAPAMVRKKSGEVVKSSLKSPSRSRPCSVPSTPTFPKNVHFDSRIAHVRHFLHSEKPSAVSVGTSPVEGTYDDHNEYPFEVEEPEWEIHLPNFPKNLEARKILPVRLEKVCLSTDKKNLIGTVAVANLSFQKHVVARFTFDYWQTVSEVAADWSSDVRRRDREEGVDRFVFKIKLAEQANLEKKTLFFCIRYNAAGVEHWDNNGGVNFQVDFKKASTQIGGPQSRALPRSRPSTPASRPLSMPNMDEFDVLDDAFFARMKELGMGGNDRPKLKSKSSVPDEEDTALPARRTNPSGNAFGNRYDFRTSLTAAIKGSSAPSHVKNLPPKTPNVSGVKPVDLSCFSLPMHNRKSPVKKLSTASNDSPSIGGATPEIFNPETFWITEDDKPSIESPSYRELLDNYCFFGSSKATKPETIQKKTKESIQLYVPNGIPTASPHFGSQSLSIAQHKSTGTASPIPLSYVGYHHRRRGSGAFRFDATKTPTAIC